MLFKNKVVLVTGSSRGIGKAIILSFAHEGAKVIINYSRSASEAKEVLKEVQKTSDGIIARCDVSDEKQVKKMIQTIINKFGKIDILVNNAGVYIDGDEWNGAMQIWEKTLKLNLISTMNVSKYVADVFLKQKSGTIINIASRYALSGNFEELAYSASKAAIVNVTQAYAKLLSPFGRANAVSPGAVRSGYWLGAPKEELERNIAALPLKKLIEPMEVASVVLFLASEKAKDINGQNITIDPSKG